MAQKKAAKARKPLTKKDLKTFDWKATLQKLIQEAPAIAAFILQLLNVAQAEAVKKGVKCPDDEPCCQEVKDACDDACEALCQFILKQAVLHDLIDQSDDEDDGTDENE